MDIIKQTGSLTDATPATGHNSHKRRLANYAMRLFGVIFCFGSISTAYSANWQFQPYVGAAFIYTDNLFLRNDLLKEDDFVMRGDLGFALNNEDGRLTGSILYNFESFFYQSDSDLDNSFHQTDARLLGELVEENLFLALRGTYFQTIVDPEAPLPINNITPLSGNRTDIFTYEVNPYADLDVGDSAAVFLSYSYLKADFGDQQNLQGRVDDSERFKTILSLGSNDTPRYQWEVRYEDIEVKYDLSAFVDFKYEQALLDIGIPITGSTHLVGIYGGESDITVDPAGGGLDSEYWQAGFRYNGGASNALEARAGQRYFGDSYFFQWNFKGAIISADASYVEQPSTLGRQQNLRPFLVPDPEPDEGVIRSSRISGEHYLDKTFNAQITASGSRSAVTFYYTDTTQEFETSPDDETLVLAGVRWNYQVGPRTDLTLQGGWAETGFRGTFVDTDGDGIPETPAPNDVEDEFIVATLSLRRQVGANLAALLGYRYADRTPSGLAPGITRGYTENSVFLEFSWGYEGQAIRRR